MVRAGSRASSVVVVLLATALAATMPGTAATPDYSKEAAVIEKLANEISFAADGTWTSRETADIRVQSEAGLQQLSVLSFGYNHDNQKIEFEYVRVRKTGGSLVNTPAENIQDISGGIDRTAPTYSDLRQKQIPVKALSVGDVLEYAIRFTQTKPEIAGQFWYSQTFDPNVVVLDQTLAISVPATKYVKIASPEIKPEEREENGRKIYFWKRAQLTPTSHEEGDAGKRLKHQSPQPSVQLTTFQSWEEVGRWYGSLQAERAAVTPEVRAKADELTRGLTSQTDKERALYDFLSTQFRYVSLSFGVGRYQPHAAAEVLSNGYGDCKDKHTLLAALLKAEGIEAWPALIGAGLKFDDTIPSPAQFNHVITFVPSGKTGGWVDSTVGVAPFELLAATIRDKKALVIPATEAPRLMTTPENPPFSSEHHLQVKGELKADGTFSGHFDITSHGDDELLLRSVFEQVPPANWREAVQSMIQSVGFAGTVSNLDVENPRDLEKPLHYSFNYTRPNYSDWPNRRISPPLFPILLAPSADEDAPEEPFFLGATGSALSEASIKLPANYSAELPENITIHETFADYTASYALHDGWLSVQRKLVIKQAKIPTADWKKYCAFAKDVASDHDGFMQLAASGAQATDSAATGKKQAEQLIDDAMRAARSGDLKAAHDLLGRAERLNPRQLNLWSGYAGLYFAQNVEQSGFEPLEEELRFHPDNVMAFRVLAGAQIHYHRNEDAIGTLRRLLKVAPDDPEAVKMLASQLVGKKRYRAVIALLQPRATDGDYALQGLLANSYLHMGQEREGKTALDRYVKSADTMALNNAAYWLADSRTDLPLAKEYGTKAVAELEEKSTKIQLFELTNEDLRLMNSLAAAWDTLGWVYFQNGDLAGAAKYLRAAWNLSQRGAAADHLGQVYEKQGEKQEAVHMWQLALAADGSLQDTRERLQKAGSSFPPRLQQTARRQFPVTPEEELGRRRTVGVPALPKQEASAEYFVLLADNRASEAEFISGSDKLKTAAAALQGAKFDTQLPDDLRVKLVRRGILSCSTYTNPSCQFVMLLPASTRR